MVTRQDKILCYILSFIFPFIGVILYFVWIGNNNPDKKKLGIKSLYFSLASFLIFALIGVVSFYSYSSGIVQG
jgi:polyferredoxin